MALKSGKSNKIDEGLLKKAKTKFKVRKTIKESAGRKSIKIKKQAQEALRKIFEREGKKGYFDEQGIFQQTPDPLEPILTKGKEMLIRVEGT